MSSKKESSPKGQQTSLDDAGVAEEQRLAAERAEAERLAAEQAEAERLAADRAEAERVAAEQAEAERLAAERAEAERLAAEQAEAERVAAEQAEAERLAAERAEAERLAAERAEAERIALSRGVVLRREQIGGKWYSAGLVLTLPAKLGEQVELDGALDLSPEAVANALANGAESLTHEAPSPDEAAQA